jgi:hypothetical protein
MRAQRIKTGFHRVGIVGAVVCAIPAIAFFAYGALVLVTQEWTEIHRNDVGVSAAVGVTWLAGAGAFYGASRAVGWIIAGFAGDGS